MRDLQPTHFNWRVDGSIAIISLARPERKNALTFDSYAELRDAFRGLAGAEDIKALVFARVGLAGCDMGACAMLPRVVGHGRAAELLFTGRAMSAEEGERWGFFNRIVPADVLETEAIALAQSLAEGPTFAHMMTKT